MQKIYAKNLCDTTNKQFQTAMSLDCNIEGALMPDAHAGYTLPIGAVIKSQGVVFPSYVGYDIGCGLCSVKINLKKDDIFNDLESLKNDILKNIPLGFNNHEQKQSLPQLPSATSVGQELLVNVGSYALGTLGGGNHFIEIGAGQDNFVSVTIHSGSRGLGAKIAEYYMNMANKNKNNGDAEGHNGFDIDSQAGQDYLQDMNMALEFALSNRRAMIDSILDSIATITELPVKIDRFINRNHNHAELVTGCCVIHRKGATHAELDMLGVVPANMKDGCFIVRGKGNPDSICSSSHGAGRVLSRSQAKKTINFCDLAREMKGIVNNHNESTIDEAPAVYKNIFEVMDLQKDLVDVVEHIKPLLNIKG